MTQAATITPRDAQRACRAYIVQHNDTCTLPMQTRVHNGQLQVRAKNRHTDWFTCTTMGQVPAYGDGIADAESYNADSLPGAPETFSPEEVAAYNAGLAANPQGY